MPSPQTPRRAAAATAAAMAADIQMESGVGMEDQVDIEADGSEEQGVN